MVWLTADFMRLIRSIPTVVLVVTHITRWQTTPISTLEVSWTTGLLRTGLCVLITAVWTVTHAITVPGHRDAFLVFTLELVFLAPVVTWRDRKDTWLICLNYVLNVSLAKTCKIIKRLCIIIILVRYYHTAESSILVGAVRAVWVAVADEAGVGTVAVLTLELASGAITRRTCLRFIWAVATIWLAIALPPNRNTPEEGRKDRQVI